MISSSMLHEQALADSEECMRLEPTNLKGHFRKGLSLHAMKRYGEAVRRG